MNIVTKMLSTAVGLTMSAGIALAEPAIIFDLGGKFDKSFNESAFTAHSAGQMKLVDLSEKLNFKTKHRENKHYVGSLRLEQTLS